MGSTLRKNYSAKEGRGGNRSRYPPKVDPYEESSLEPEAKDQDLDEWDLEGDEGSLQRWLALEEQNYHAYRSQIVKSDADAKTLTVIKFGRSAAGGGCQGSDLLDHTFRYLKHVFPSVVFIQANVEWNRRAVRKFGIVHTPTFIALKGNEVVGRHSGVSKDDLLDFVSHCAQLCSKTRLR